MVIVRKSNQEPHEWDPAWDALSKLDEAIALAMPTVPPSATPEDVAENAEIVSQFYAQFEEERDLFLRFLIQKRLYENEEFGQASS